MPGRLFYIEGEELTQRWLTAKQKALLNERGLLWEMGRRLVGYVGQVWRTNNAGKWAPKSAATRYAESVDRRPGHGGTNPAPLRLTGALEASVGEPPKIMAASARLQVSADEAQKAYWQRRGRRAVEVYHAQVAASTTLATQHRVPTAMPKRNPAPRPDRSWIEHRARELLAAINDAD
jgi:hypothetical protein